MPHRKRVVVGLTVGDINGIGPEIVMKALSDSRILDFMTPVVYGSSKLVAFHKKANKISDFSFTKLDDKNPPKGKQVFLKECWKEEVRIDIGKETQDGGKYAIKSLKEATKDLAEGKIDVLVTAPINKNNVQSPEFNFPGHTEYLASVAHVEEALMFMVSDKLRVAVVTGHVPLKDVASKISKESILNKLELLNASLIKDFGIRRPKIAVLGLNPHAGDKGVIGEEDSEIVSPAIKSARNKDILAFGPYSADGFFGNGSFKKYDAVLAMYHDQGLIPFKSITFGEGVNYTAGLPIVRTSPDHGTAYDIAGKNEASEMSIRNAIFQAVDIFRKREEYKELTANPLPLSEAK